MKVILRIIGAALCVLGLLQEAGAENAALLARADWEEYLQEVRKAAEDYLRNATQGTGDILVNEVGYLQARRYYQQVLLLSPGDPEALGSKRIVEEQLARFRRQHRWRLLKSTVVNSFRGSPTTRYLNNGLTLEGGRTSFDLDADERLDDNFVRDHWSLILSRRAVPLLFQLQGGIGRNTTEEEFDDDVDEQLSWHAGAEVDYTVLPLFSYVLPYVGIGYRIVRGTYNKESDLAYYDGDFLFHGTYLRLGATLSLGRRIKISANHARSLKIYGSEFNSYEDGFSSAGDYISYEDDFSSAEDYIDSWTATRLSVGILF